MTHARTTNPKGWLYSVGAILIGTFVHVAIWFFGSDALVLSSQNFTLAIGVSLVTLLFIAVYWLKSDSDSFDLKLFVSSVIGVAVSSMIIGAMNKTIVDIFALVMLASLAILAENFRLHLHADSTVSVSLVPLFAATALCGFIGSAVVSAAIALSHAFRERPRLHQVAFNWAAHSLAASLAAILLPKLIQLDTVSLPLIISATLVCGAVYYAIEIGLINVVVSLSRNTSLLFNWQLHFDWLMVHYLALSLSGLFMAVAYSLLGITGLIVFIMPAMLMRFTQKQYIDKTRATIGDLQKTNAQLQAANAEIVEAHQRIAGFNDELLSILSRIIDARDRALGGHANKVADYALAIGKKLGLDDERLTLLRQAAFLHDIGKLGVPEKILFKPGKLTEEEYTLVKAHVTMGAFWLSETPELKQIAPFVRHHHERWDGKGYPDRLCGEAAPLEARILALCDAVEAMASDRPYHRAMQLSDIVNEIVNCSGKQFDPTVVSAFLSVLKDRGDDFVVNSADGLQVDWSIFADSSPKPFIVAG
jgi:hypothetical protein